MMKITLYGKQGHAYTVAFKNFLNSTDVPYIYKDISKDVEGMFSDLQKKIDNNITHPDDPSGESKIFKIVYWFQSGDIVGIKCFDWSKSKAYADSLKFQLKLKEFNEWLTPN